MLHDLPVESHTAQPSYREIKGSLGNAHANTFLDLPIATPVETPVTRQINRQCSDYRSIGHESLVE